ncbi:Uncharacterised protein [Salmonella enterica subsp. enterica serovar Typhimurium str. DT104]|nr:Uncharacterised protein [Salmonella enterica subsp. enterica serovar Typhimurium str. DT104]
MLLLFLFFLSVKNQNYWIIYLIPLEKKIQNQQLLLPKLVKISQKEIIYCEILQFLYLIQ